MDALELYDLVKKHRDEIIAAGDAGDSTALNIQRVYNMCVRHADVPTVAILEALMEDFMKSIQEDVMDRLNVYTQTQYAIGEVNELKAALDLLARRAGSDDLPDYDIETVAQHVKYKRNMVVHYINALDAAISKSIQEAK